MKRSGVLWAAAVAVAGCTPPPDGLHLFSSNLPQGMRSVFRVAWRIKILPDTVEEPPLGFQLERWAPLESSGPVVVPGREIIVGTTDGRVAAYSLIGKPLWSFETQGPISQAVSVVGPYVYVASGDGRVYALDPVGGAELWRFETGEEPASTPVVSLDKVFVTTHQGSLFALDAATGKRLWHYHRDLRREFTLRRVAEPRVDGPVVLTGFADGTTVALKVENGGLAWEHLAKAGEQILDANSTPQIGAGRVYVATFRDGILALRRSTGEELWHKAFPAATGLLLHKGILYASAVGKLSALSPIDGSSLWERGLGERTPGALSIEDSMLVVPTSDSLLFLDDRSGRQLGAAFNPGRGIDAAPATAGRQLFVLSNAGWLYALRLL